MVCLAIIWNPVSALGRLSWLPVGRRWKENLAVLTSVIGQKRTFGLGSAERLIGCVRYRCWCGIGFFCGDLVEWMAQNG